jgi:signal transduction histidine kinase
MTPILHILNTLPFFNWPSTLAEWLGLSALALITLWLGYSWRKYQQPIGDEGRKRLLWLAASVPAASLLFGLRLPGSDLPIPGLPIEPRGPALMLFAAIPWMLGGGLFGPVTGALLGAFSGLILGLWDTHSLYTLLEYALMGLLFSVMIRQRYRTPFYRIIGQPVAAALVLIPVYGIIFTFVSFLISSGQLAAQVDFALTRLGLVTLAVAGELLLAALVCQILVIFFPKAWRRDIPLQPSPAERSLSVRFLYGTGSLIVILLLALLVGDWLVAGRAARDMLRERLVSTAQMAGESVPFFLETGQGVILQIAADARLGSGDEAGLAEALGGLMQSYPFFDELYVVDESFEVKGSFPAAGQFETTPEIASGIGLALAAQVEFQYYALPPDETGIAARIAFIAAIPGSQRALVGISDLGHNPLTRPMLNSLEGISALDGSGILLDEQGRMLYHPVSGLVMQPYPGQLRGEPDFFDDTAPDGTRSLVYFQPTRQMDWAVVLSVPASQTQQLALEIAAPLSAMILVLGLAALISLRLGLLVVTNSLQTLANEATQIARGEFDHPLEVTGVDEVGQLRGAFEQMRASLQARLEELNRLLAVSQGVASSFDMQDAMQPILAAVYAGGASAVRIVLAPSAVPESPRSLITQFGLGDNERTYAWLDETVMVLTQQQDRVIIPNFSRVRGLDVDTGKPRPGALLAVTLRHENRYFGALWAAYDDVRQFSEPEIRFISTLAGQAALAAGNNYLFQTAEVGRRQLEAILTSTPDPVLVTDQNSRLLLANPAAWRTLGREIKDGKTKPIDTVLQNSSLLDLLQASTTETLSAEVTLPDGQIFLATASSVVAEGRLVGRVCILRDVTHFKELDKMKSEFVSTVSHDLRSPLTLMRGYATMLDMVGQLNEQQKSYVRKIITGVENMARLINDLLDLGRIEIGVGLNVEDVPLIEIVDKVVSTLQPQAASKSIQLDVELPRDLPKTIEADKTLFYQAVYNLVENAIKYTPAEKSVRIAVKADDQSVLFEIEDTGIGILDEDKSRMFEKFFRGTHREARALPGSGLGLAIVKSIAERHRGKVWLKSKADEGSTFYLQVPLTQPG